MGGGIGWKLCVLLFTKHSLRNLLGTTYLHQQYPTSLFCFSNYIPCLPARLVPPDNIAQVLLRAVFHSFASVLHLCYLSFQKNHFTNIYYCECTSAHILGTTCICTLTKLPWTHSLFLGAYFVYSSTQPFIPFLLLCLLSFCCRYSLPPPPGRVISLTSDENTYPNYYTWYSPNVVYN